MVEIAWFLRWTALWQRLSGVQILVGWYEKDRQVVLLDYTVDLIWYLAINLCPGKRSMAGSVQTYQGYKLCNMRFDQKIPQKYRQNVNTFIGRKL